MAAGESLIAALRESEERFRRLAENAEDFVYRFELHPIRRYAYVNPAVERLWGYRPEELYADPDLALKIVHPDDRPLLASMIQGENLNPEVLLRWRHRDGRIVWMEFRRTPVYGPDGSLVALEGIGRDVTERRRIDETQRALADLSNSLAEAGLNPDAVLARIAQRVSEVIGDGCAVRLLSEDGRYLQVAAVYHPDPEALALMNGIMAAAPLPADEGAAGRVVGAGESIRIPELSEEEARAIYPAPYWTYLDRYGIRGLLVVPLRARGRVLGTIGVTRDTPGRPYSRDDEAFLRELADRAGIALDNARLYAALEEAVRARDRFLSIAAHELKTPVTSVKGFAQTLLRSVERGAIDPDRLRRGLQRLNEAGDRLGQLTDDLLDVGRLRTGRLELRPRTVDLAATVREHARRFEEKLADRHRIVVVTTGTDCTVQADPERIDQVLLNLLDNAAKYSPDGGDIRICIGPERSGVAVAVQDEGIGLPRGSEETIFEPFGRAPNAVASSLPGMGLGLHVVRGIVERHGGTIRAESPGEGQGTTMTVWLPRQPPGGV